MSLSDRSFGEWKGGERHFFEAAPLWKLDKELNGGDCHCFISDVKVAIHPAENNAE